MAVFMVIGGVGRLSRDRPIQRQGASGVFVLSSTSLEDSQWRRRLKFRGFSYFPSNSTTFFWSDHAVALAPLNGKRFGEDGTTYLIIGDTSSIH
jgi:hypothetical protein